MQSMNAQWYLPRYDNVQLQRQRLDAEIQKRMTVLDAIQELEDDREGGDTRGVNVNRANELLKRIDYFNK